MNNTIEQLSSEELINIISHSRVGNHRWSIAVIELAKRNKANRDVLKHIWGIESVPNNDDIQVRNQTQEKQPQKWWQNSFYFSLFIILMNGLAIVIAALSSLQSTSSTLDFSLGLLFAALIGIITVPLSLIGNKNTLYFFTNIQVQITLFRLKSADPSLAKKLVEKIKENGWDKDGSLQNANLSWVVLRDIDMRRAKLDGANLHGAKLSNVDFGNASLKFTNCIMADLRGANLREADLSKSILSGADLRNTDLTDAYLYGADITSARFEGSILPNGEDWNLSIDMRRYTHSKSKELQDAEDAQSLIVPKIRN